MPEYHVGAGLFGIYCGVLNKPRKDGSVTWKDKTECTNEAFCAVRDFLIQKVESEELSRGGYEWTTTDGKVVRLILEIEEAPNDTLNEEEEEHG